MKVGVFCVFDSAAKAYLPPFFIRSVGEAIRSFTDAVSDTKHQFASHKEDYTLFQLGEWDDNSGMFSTIEPRKIVGAWEIEAGPLLQGMGGH